MWQNQAFDISNKEYIYGDIFFPEHNASSSFHQERLAVPWQLE